MAASTGVEFTANYKQDNVSAYLNLACSRAQGKNIDSAQFNFEPDELAFITNHWVFLDHDQRVTASFGGTYDLGKTTFTFDGHRGQWLAQRLCEHRRCRSYAQVNLGVIQHFNRAAHRQIRCAPARAHQRVQSRL